MKHVVHTRLDIYVFLNYYFHSVDNSSKGLLVIHVIILPLVSSIDNVYYIYLFPRTRRFHFSLIHVLQYLIQ
jgi:hypothetical protein